MRQGEVGTVSDTAVFSQSCRTVPATYDSSSLLVLILFPPLFSVPSFPISS